MDDEDSIATLPTITTGSTTVAMQVAATNSTATAAALVCYIDFNRDGDFGDVGEQSGTVAAPANSGTANYAVSFSGFGAPVAGDSYIRCRIAFAAADVSAPVGPAQSGEVEDFRSPSPSRPR